MTKPQTMRISMVVPLTRRTIAALNVLRAAMSQKAVQR